MEDLATLGVRVDSDGVAQATNRLNRFGAAGQRVETATDRLNRTLAVLKRAMATLGIIVVAQQMIRLADQMRLLEGRLKLVTNGFQDLRRVQAQLFALSQNTRSSYQVTVELFTRMSRALRGLGVTQGQVLDVTKAINLAVQVSGATAQEARNGIIQLSQGFASGVLRGQEFNAVSEQMPRVLEALQSHLGKTRGELRQMAEQGKLTARVVFDALYNSRGVLEREFGQLPRTVGQTLTQIKNEFARLVDIGSRGGFLDGLTAQLGRIRDILSTPAAAQFARDLGSTLASAVRVLGNAIAFLVRNFDILKSLLIFMGARMLATAVLSNRLVRGFGALALSVRALTPAMGAMTAATATAAGAWRGLMAAMIANPIGIIATLLASVVSAASLLTSRTRDLSGALTRYNSIAEDTLRLERDILDTRRLSTKEIADQAIRLRAKTDAEIIDLQNKITEKRAKGDFTAALTGSDPALVYVERLKKLQKLLTRINQAEYLFKSGFTAITNPTRFSPTKPSTTPSTTSTQSTKRTLDRMMALKAEVEAQERLTRAMGLGAAAYREMERVIDAENRVRQAGLKLTTAAGQKRLKDVLTLLKARDAALAYRDSLKTLQDLQQQQNQLKFEAGLVGLSDRDRQVALETRRLMVEHERKYGQFAKLSEQATRARVAANVDLANAIQSRKTILGSEKDLLAQIAEVEAQRSVLGLSERQGRIQLELHKKIADWKRQGLDYTAADVANQQKLITNLVDQQDQYELLRKAQEQYRALWTDLFNGLESGFSNMFKKVFEGGRTGFKDFLGVIKSEFAKFATSLVRQNFLRPLLGQAFGLVGAPGAPRQIAGANPFAFIGQGTSGLNSAGRALAVGSQAGFGIPTPANSNTPGGQAGLFSAFGSFGKYLGQAATGGATGYAVSNVLQSLGVGGVPGTASAVSGSVGGSIGGAAGGIIGNMILPGLGGIIGSALGSIGGSLLGGLFGNKRPSVGPNAGTLVGLRDDGRLYIRATGQDNGGDPQNAIRITEGFFKAIEQLQSDMGLHIQKFGGFKIQTYKNHLQTGFGNGIIAKTKDPTQLIEKTLFYLLKRGVNRPERAIFGGFTDRDQTVLRNSSARDLKALMDDFDFARKLPDILQGLDGVNDKLLEITRTAKSAAQTQIDKIMEISDRATSLGFANEGIRAMEALRDQLLSFSTVTPKISETQKALAALEGQFEALRMNADALGLTMDRIAQAEMAARGQLRTGFDQGIQFKILNIVDPLAARLQEFDDIAQQRLSDARLLGANLLEVERLNALERQRIIEEAAGGATSSLRKFFEEITFGKLSGVAPVLGLTGARSLFNSTAEAALNGDSFARSRVEELGRQLLETSRGFFASSEGYQRDLDLVQGVVGQLITANDTGGANAVVVDAINVSGAENARLLSTIVDVLNRSNLTIEQLREELSRQNGDNNTDNLAA